jgi:hypothetical protein
MRTAGIRKRHDRSENLTNNFGSQMVAEASLTEPKDYRDEPFINSDSSRTWLLRLHSSTDPKGDPQRS